MGATHTLDFAAHPQMRAPANVALFERKITKHWQYKIYCQETLLQSNKHKFPYFVCSAVEFIFAAFICICFICIFFKEMQWQINVCLFPGEKLDAESLQTAKMKQTYSRRGQY